MFVEVLALLLIQLSIIILTKLMTQSNAPETITFPDAIALTRSLLDAMAENTLDETAIQDAIASLVKSENGARGFFVTYLTDERPFAEHPSAAVVCALRSSPDIVSELLVKNLAMSAAMALTHRRNQNEEMAKGSERVLQRTTHLIKQIQLDSVSDKLQLLRESVTTGTGHYQAFLERWEYDPQQKQMMQQALSDVELA